ncbi:phage tail tape measure protein, partial [Bacillus sp. HC-TM]
LSESLGKIAQLYKIPTRNIEQLGDALNYLDDNAMSKGADIIDVMQRLGGVADRLDYRKAAALGSTFLTVHPLAAQRLLPPLLPYWRRPAGHVSDLPNCRQGLRRSCAHHLQPVQRNQPHCTFL